MVTKSKSSNSKISDFILQKGLTANRPGEQGYKNRIKRHLGYGKQLYTGFYKRLF